MKSLDLDNRWGFMFEDSGGFLNPNERLNRIGLDWETYVGERHDEFYGQSFDEPFNGNELGTTDYTYVMTPIKRQDFTPYSPDYDASISAYERSEQMFDRAQEKDRLAYERSIERGEQMFERAQERERLAYERNLARSEREGMAAIKKHERELEQEELRMKHFALQMSNSMDSFGKSIDNFSNAGIGFLSQF